MSNGYVEKIPANKIAESNGFAFKCQTGLPSFPKLLPKMFIIDL